MVSNQIPKHVSSSSSKLSAIYHKKAEMSLNRARKGGRTGVSPPLPMAKHRHKTRNP